MYPNKMSHPICNYLPSYKTYDGFNAVLATGFLSLVELIIRFANGLRG